MKEIEHEEQVNLMKWWHFACYSFGLPESILFAIPNGGQRNIIVASKMKSEGVRAGIPDLFFAVPRGVYHGLFIEMKKPKGGRLSAKQKEMISHFEFQSYACAVCAGWESARHKIIEYLKGKHNDSNTKVQN